MPLDPSIILQGRPVQLPDVGQMVQLRNLGLQGDAAQMNLDAQQRGAQQSATLARLYQKNTRADGTVDNAAMSADLAASGLGAQIPGFQKSNQEAASAATEAQSRGLALQKQKLDLVNGALSSLLAQPTVTHDQVISTISSLVDRGVVSNDQGAKMVQGLPGPDQLRPFLMSQAMQSLDASKRLELMLPKYDEQDRGGTISQGTIDPLTGVRTAGADIVKTATPGEKLNAQAKAQAAADGSMAKYGPLLAALADNGVSLPAGLRSKDQMRATLQGLLDRYPGKNADEIAYGVGSGQINFGSDKKSTQTAAAIEGRVNTAINELAPMGDQVLAASAKVPRGKFVPATALMQMADSAISDPNLLTLKLKLNALNNAYNVLAARGGTDAASRDHVAQLFKSATGPEGIAALVKGLKEEGDAAKSASAGASHRGPAGAPTAAAPTTTSSGATVSNWGP